MPAVHVIMEPETLEERIGLQTKSVDKTKNAVERFAILTVVFAFVTAWFTSALASSLATATLQPPWSIILPSLCVLWLTGTVLSAVNMFMYGLKWTGQKHWLQLLQMKLETEGNQPA